MPGRYGPVEPPRRADRSRLQGAPPPATVAPVPPQPPPAAEPSPEAHTRSLLNSLKEELFALEADRARGNVGEVEYAAHKQALEAIIRRALNR